MQSVTLCDIAESNGHAESGFKWKGSYHSRAFRCYTGLANDERAVADVCFE